MKCEGKTANPGNRASERASARCRCLQSYRWGMGEREGRVQTTGWPSWLAS